MRAETILFKDVFQVDPLSGRINLGSNRHVMLDAAAVGAMRHELMDNLGWEVTRGIFVRIGYQCGTARCAPVAEALPLPSDEEWLRAGLRLHYLEGMAKARLDEFEIDRCDGKDSHYGRVAGFLRSRAPSAAIRDRQPIRLLDARRICQRICQRIFRRGSRLPGNSLPRERGFRLQIRIPVCRRLGRGCAAGAGDAGHRPVHGTVRPLSAHNQRHGLRTGADISGCSLYNRCQRHHHILQPGRKRDPGHSAQRSHRETSQLFLCREAIPKRNAIMERLKEQRRFRDYLTEFVTPGGTKNPDRAIGFRDSQPGGRHRRHDRGGARSDRDPASGR